MVSSCLALAGLALLAWPRVLAGRRLRKLLGQPHISPRPRLLLRVGSSWPKVLTHRPAALLVVVAAASLAGSPLGPGGAFATALLAATGWWRWQRRRQQRDRHAAHEGMAEALRALVLELRAGTHPATAAESVALDAHPQAAVAMRAIAGTTRLGGEVDRALAGITAVPALNDVLDQLVQAWRLVQRHGLPLADVLAAVRRELDGRVRFATQVHARMAGPRASSTVLASLPAVGVLLGEAMGAGPLHVLGSTAIGQALLALGAVLVCAGIAWSARLTEQAVLS